VGDGLAVLVASGHEPADYVSFFEVLAGASAAILALVLATFQLNIDRWRAHPLREPVALVTLAELAAPLFFSLMFLLPSHPWRWTGVLPGGVGYLAIILHVSQYIRWRSEAERFDHIQLWIGNSIVVFTFSVLAWSSSLPWKAAVCIWFIFSGVTEAWFFIPRPDRGARHMSERGVA
jgi:hypothetical protein